MASSSLDVFVQQGGISLASAVLQKYPETQGPSLLYFITGLFLVGRLLETLINWLLQKLQAGGAGGRAQWYADLMGGAQGLSQITASFNAGLISRWLLDLMSSGETSSSVYLYLWAPIW
jgi:hypothetical protein